MPSPKPVTLAALGSGLLAGAPALAAGQLDLRIQIPQIDVAEYHRPYVAVWLERDDRSVAANLSVWYQQKRSGSGPAPANAEGGSKWLPDLRQWWRRAGRELSLPLDGLSGATRPVGEHALSFKAGDGRLPVLPPGRYRLVVEAAREEGGRELLDIPFDWPASGAQQLRAQGKTELGAVQLALKP